LNIHRKPSTTFSRVAIAAVLCIAGISAFAQNANPFVSAAQAPGFVPPPPPPPQPVTPSPVVTPVQPAGSLKPAGSIPPPPQPPTHPGRFDSATVAPNQTPPNPKEAASLALQRGKKPDPVASNVPVVKPAPPAPKVDPADERQPIVMPVGQGNTNNIYLPGSPSITPPAEAFGGGGAVIDRAALVRDTIQVQKGEFTAEVGKTYRLEASTAAPNLIISPFEEPKLLTSSQDALRFVAHGRNLVVTVSAGGPVGAYITGKNPDDPLVAVVFEPKPVPPRNYTMNVDGVIVKKKSATDSKGGRKTASSAVRGSAAEHTQRVVGLVQQVLMEKVPDGFGEVPTKSWPEARSQDGIVAQPIALLSSGEETITTLLVTNTSDRVVQLEENDFYGPGVEAVALTPHREIGPGEAIKAIVLRRVDEASAPNTLMSITRE
jgi:hypothetical protein